MLNLIVVKSKNKYYATVTGTNSYYNSSMGSYFINGKKPSPSFKSNWVVIDRIPKTIQHEVLQPDTNKRYELEDKKLLSIMGNNMKEVFTQEEFLEENEDGNKHGKNE
jgi:hypothetical protein